MKALALSLLLATALFVREAPVHASTSACTVAFAVPNSLGHTLGSSRTTFADLTTWNASGSPPQRIYNSTEFTDFQDNSPAGSIYSPLWDYTQKCISSTGSTFNMRFVPAPLTDLGLQGTGGAYDHFHLDFTDPAWIEGEGAPYYCACDPGDGYGAGFAPVVNGACPTNAQCATEANWAYEPRNLSPHAPDEWVMLFLDGFVCDPTHCWSGNGVKETFEVGEFFTGSSGGSMEAWFEDIYGQYYYEGPIPANSAEWAPTSNSLQYVLFRSYKGTATPVYTLKSVQVIPDN